MADCLEAFVPMRLHVLMRFGRWEGLIAQPLPADPELYCTTTAMTHYARGVAHAATGRMAEAEAAPTPTRSSPPSGAYRKPAYLFNNTCRDILAVAGAMLDGEIAYRRGRFEEAFEHLRRAIELDDALPYDEPWGWMQPTRTPTARCCSSRAIWRKPRAVYRSDLGFDGKLSRACQHPDNVWSLHGLHECLSRRGDLVEAPLIKARLDMALARAEGAGARLVPVPRQAA